MCESEQIRRAKTKRAMLNDHVGRNVTVILKASNNNIFQGRLTKQSLPGTEREECWVVTADRGLVPNGPHGATAVPETKIYFVADDLGYIIVPQETKEQAAEKLESDRLAVDLSLASPGWSHHQ